MENVTYKNIITYRKSIFTCMSDSRWGFGLEIGFIDHLQIVTTSNYNSLTELHTLQTLEHTDLCSQYFELIPKFRRNISPPLSG
jgi:hypothetical protein